MDDAVSQEDRQALHDAAHAAKSTAANAGAPALADILHRLESDAVSAGWDDLRRLAQDAGEAFAGIENYRAGFPAAAE